MNSDPAVNDRVDVVLVYLPVRFGGGKNFGLPPLGVYYLAAALEEGGISVRVLDASIKGLSFEETIAQIDACSPTVVGISAMTPHIKSLIKTVDKLNDIGYRGRIAVGGSHFNATGAEALDYLDVDYLFYGESERNFTEFVKRRIADQPVDDIPTMAYRQGDEVTVNAKGNFIDELDELPFPNLRYGDPDDYEFVAGRYDRVTSMMASRGCPYLCTFCDVFAIWGRKLRLRSAENICDEIEFNMKTLGIREFVFKDSTFTLNFKWLDRFLSELERRKLDISWQCNTRADRVDFDMLKRMRDTGLRVVSFGVESGDQDIINSIEKNLQLDTIHEAFRMANELGLQAQAFFMIGHVGETRETARRTVELAVQLPATYASFAVNVAYPGTPSYDQALKQGLLLDPKWYLYGLEEGEEQFLSIPSEASTGQLMHHDFPPVEQMALTKEAYRRFYLRPSVIWRIIHRAASFRLLWRAAMFLPTFLAFSIFSKPSKDPFRGGYAMRQADAAE